MKTNSILVALAVHARTLVTRRHPIFRRAWLRTGFLAFAMIASERQPAQAAITEAWVQRFGSETGSADYASKVVTDAAGTVIVAGTTLDNQTVGESDMLVIKYSGAGVPLWTNRHDGLAAAIAVDGSGNVFVTGSSTGSGGVSDFATIAYSGAGVPLWTNRYDRPGNNDDQATAIAVDASGNVFVTGYSGYLNGSLGNHDYVTTAYSGEGVPLWTNLYLGTANGYFSDGASAVALDGNGNVFVTGTSGNPFRSSSYATIAYSGPGVPLWTNSYSGPENLSGQANQANAVAVHASGNVFVTGWSGYSCFFGCGGGDYATIAYSGAGVPLWTNRYDGPGNNDDQATAIAVDASGNVFVTGYSAASGGDWDYATIGYSGVGVPLWTNRYDGPGNNNDQATAIAVDANGNVFVTGSSGTIAYSGTGVPLCTNRYGGSDLAIGSDGAVYVTGASAGLSSSDSATVKYLWRPEIAIQLLPAIPPKLNLTLSGAPNSSCAIERAPHLTGPWTNLSALVIGPNGSAQLQDTNSLYPAGFYRARQQ